MITLLYINIIIVICKFCVYFNIYYSIILYYNVCYYNIIIIIYQKLNVIH